MKTNNVVNILLNDRIWSFYLGDMPQGYRLFDFVAGEVEYCWLCRGNAGYWDLLAEGDEARSLWRMLISRANELGMLVDAETLSEEEWDVCETLAAARRALQVAGMRDEIAKIGKLLMELAERDKPSGLVV